MNSKVDSLSESNLIVSKQAYKENKVRSSESNRSRWFP
jgi:hypothetical protein